MRFGLIADTHGFLGTDALTALRDCDQILHAGDIGEGVLAPLRALAPLTAVRGNNDTAGEAAACPALVLIDVPGHTIAVVHRLVDAPADGWDILVYGHCHRQHADRDARGRLALNPGAAGRRGFHQRRSVAVLTVEGGAEPTCTFLDLGLRSDAR
jgi:putative phosphoesterase